jgi:hypothetical protein
MTPRSGLFQRTLHIANSKARRRERFSPRDDLDRLPT